MPVIARWVAGALAVACAIGPSARAQADDKEVCIAESETAQRLALQGKLVEARSHFVACGREGCPSLVVKDCAEQLAHADRSIATVVLSARSPDGHEVPNARVVIDGAATSAAVDGRAIPLDPGPHTFRFVSNDGATKEQSVVLAEGAHFTPIVVTFAGPAPRATPAGSERAPVPFAAYLLGGVGVAALGVMTGFGIAAIEQSSDLHARTPTQYTEDDVSSLKTKRLVADVSLGVAVVAIGAATWMVLARPRRRSGSARLP